MKYLIVCGGNIEQEFACEVIKKSGIDVIIAADRGMDFLYQNGITPDIIVGDFDSTKTKALGYFVEKGQSEIHTLNPVKDDTDTEFAIRTAMERGARNIVMIGATGSRLDHVLGNISLLGVGLKNDVSIEILDPNNRIRMIDRPVTLKKNKQYGKYISLIPVSTDNEVSLTGFKYTLDHHVFDKYTSLGISNEITDDEAVIDIHKGTFIIVESRD